MAYRRPARRMWRLRFGLLLLTLSVLLAAEAALAFRALSARRSATEPARLRDIPNTDVNPYGANLFLAREVEPWKVDKTLQMAADAGISWVKQHFPWEEIEPYRKGEYLVPTTKSSSWVKYDRIVDACEKYGLRIVARLDRPPDWTREDNTYKQRPPDNLEDYGDFVYAFVRRYAGRIDYIQIWNEPNIFPEWGNQPVDPAQYVELLRIAYRRAKEANPNVWVLSAPLAITLGQPHPEPGKWISMSDLQFLEEMYKAGAKEYFDIYSANAFGMDLPPEDPADPDVLNFQRVLLQRRVMERYGDRDKAVWFNEYAWNAAPASMPAEQLIWRRVSEQQQAEYTLRGIELARRDWPWAGVFMIWYFRQVGHIPPDRADYYFRMVDPDFTPRMVYFAVRDATRGLSPPGQGLHQETSPHVTPYGEWRHVIDDSALSRAYITSSNPGDSVAFTFRGAAVDLLTRRGPGAGRLLLSLDGRAVENPPSSAEGTSYVELSAPSLEPRARVPLVRNASTGEHVLRITVAADSAMGPQAGECVVDAFDIVPSSASGSSFAALLVGGVAIVLNGYMLWRTWRRLRWSWRAP